MTLTIAQATLSELDDLSSMFDEYRRFYRQSSDLEATKNFLAERIKSNESIAFIAYLNNQPVGFIHLYPTYSSVHLKRIWVLNDLYVNTSSRRKGVGFELIDAAIELAKKTDALCIKVSTAQSNFTAQQVYAAKGFRRDYQFFHYILPLMD